MWGLFLAFWFGLDTILICSDSCPLTTLVKVPPQFPSSQSLTPAQFYFLYRTCHSEWMNEWMNTHIWHGQSRFTVVSVDLLLHIHTHSHHFPCVLSSFTPLGQTLLSVMFIVVPLCWNEAVGWVTLLSRAWVIWSSSHGCWRNSVVNSCNTEALFRFCL